ncbi:hypothetical protein TWF225_001501 [Orbilia oligospora]|uniref:Uncharacterized protein n=2 Tax=Orbilia oligospora TaxID=2813651 RepID=A0A7C8TTY7_ORBOL|nr:hypothetical protein TWF751_010873 [Orbilia oligospora]KAF3191364.1 hypothetical protein TWF225_001501 [Orbilia oligospora]KAF3267830.1 hypothetical protein TWF217_011561 [Orbilia oligospora]KAF3269551.1 hypothetical protein TWF128_005758 [Orbilia oligospora]KAF3296553.1 hypothetical protein TWF132_010146 [Orbilia oligospora]
MTIFFVSTNYTLKMAGLDAIIYRKQPSRLDRILAQPHRYIAQTLYRLQPTVALPNPDRLGNSSIASSNELKVVCISDTHNNQFQDIPDSDILVHAGDITENGTIEELQKSIDWLDSLPHKYKVVIAGNHDRCLDPNHKSPSNGAVNWKGLLYLQDSSIVLNIPGKSRAVKIYGNPSSPKHGTSTFQYPRSEYFWKNKVPEDVDILVTHAPPRYHLDSNAGCASLIQEIWRVRPKLHIFGHIHSGRGTEVLAYDQFQRCYERLSEKEHVVVNIILMLWYLAIKFLHSICRIDPKNGETILVNATMVRGRKNEPIASGSTSAIIYL